MAVCTDSRRYELPPAQRRAAQQRALEERAKARRGAAEPPADAASRAGRSPNAASQPDASRPFEFIPDAADCATWWRTYDESVACFGPFRTVQGSIKAEGFDKCPVVQSPEGKCGARTN